MAQTRKKPEGNGNMELWERVCKTDPAMTKKVQQRGGFTSICAQYMVMRATAEFGPIGVGWGFACEHSIWDGLAICDVTIWTGKRANNFGPVRGMNPLRNGQRLDDDAPKKAMTDALKKGLSHLGICADVFLGKFDDDKYLAQMQQEFAPPDTPPTTPPPTAPQPAGQAERDAAKNALLRGIAARRASQGVKTTKPDNLHFAGLLLRNRFPNHPEGVQWSPREMTELAEALGEYDMATGERIPEAVM